MPLENVIDVYAMDDYERAHGSVGRVLRKKAREAKREAKRKATREAKRKAKKKY